MRRIITVVALFALGIVAYAADPKSGSANKSGDWSATVSLTAPEANQAAATDEKFVYAITNTLVAKYDRLTGTRIAVSTGAAKHLNSGYLWEGKLFCAHSNYPLTPEHSEIKVLDSESMRLATFKDFGNFGGSLTWAVRRDDRWWCNFARYGADNSGTFLVEFDAEWNEQARWTYPAAVLNKLGQYSLSGGTWCDRDLLVDPLLFRLRLPNQGRVLEFIDTQSVPFTGQGFASDPQTGGLVGINRAKKQVIFAVQ
ncbi:MAG: endonuclease [Planctomycetota bacterium]